MLSARGGARARVPAARADARRRARRASASLELLDEAVGARIVSEVPRSGRPATRSRTRSSARRSTRSSRRRRASASIAASARCSRTSTRPTRSPHLAEIAHHFFQGAPAATPSAVVRRVHARGGARARAPRVRGSGRPLRARARRRSSSRAAATRRARRDSCSALGDAQSRAGERERARATFRSGGRRGARARPARPARARRARVRRPRASSGCRRGRRAARAPRGSARALLGAGDVALRARLLSRLVGTAPYSDSMATRDALSAEAVALARAARRPRRRSSTALERARLGAPRPRPRRRAPGDRDRAARLARRGRDRYDAFLAHEVRFDALLAQGRHAGRGPRGRRDRGPRGGAAAARAALSVAVFRASRALSDGRFDEADATDRGRAGARRARPAPGCPSARGGTEDIRSCSIAAGRRLCARASRPSSNLSGRGQRGAHRHGARLPRARLDGRRATRVRSARRGRLPGAAARRALADRMAQLAYVCAALGDERRAAVLYDLLVPFADRNAVHNLLRVSDGSVSHFLGLLAATMAALGRRGTAVRGRAREEHAHEQPSLRGPHPDSTTRAPSWRAVAARTELGRARSSSRLPPPPRTWA